MDDRPLAMRPFTESLPMALLQARESTMRLFRPMLSDHDLTEQQWRVLRALTASDHSDDGADAGPGPGPDAGDLARRTFLLSPSLSRILANLEDRGLIVRCADQADSRRTLITLTDQGRELVATVAPDSERLYASIEAAFGAERLDRLLAELDDLANIDFNASAAGDQP